jgi:hypothetical protein
MALAVPASHTKQPQRKDVGESARKFRDTVAEMEAGPSMGFDYRLRSGLATSTNALRLMELVGFDLPDG